VRSDLPSQPPNRAFEPPTLADSPRIPERDEGPRAGGDGVLICWRYPDGSLGRGSLLPRAVADEILRDYVRKYPERSFWVERGT